MKCPESKFAQDEAIYREAYQQAQKGLPIDAALAQERARLPEEEPRYGRHEEARRQPGRW